MRLRILPLEERIVLDAALPAAIDAAEDADGAHLVDSTPADDAAVAQVPPVDPAENDAIATDDASPPVPDASASNNVVLVADNLPDVQQLIDAAAAINAEALVFDADGESAADILDRVAETLKQEPASLQHLSILTHGEAGSFDLGTDRIESAQLDTTAAAWTRLEPLLSEGAGVYLYTCSLTATDDGQALLNNLADLTGADVYGSNDWTGGLGDWDLEAASAGAPTATGPLSGTLLADYTHEIDASLIAHWTFDENGGQVAGDSGTTGADLQLGSTAGVDASDPTWAAGRLGTALSFDGDDYLTTSSDVLDFAPDDAFSISAWVNRSNDAAIHVIASKMDNVDPYQGWFVWVNTSGQIQFNLRESYDGGAGEFLSVSTNETVLAADGWQHVTLTYDGSITVSGLHIYIGGEEATFSGTSETLLATSDTDSTAPTAPCPGTKSLP